MFKCLVLSFLLGGVAVAAPKHLKIKSSDVSFLAVGNPGWLEIEGTGGKLTPVGLTIDGSVIQGTVKVDLRQVTTDMDTRDRHMREKYLEVKKYPWAILKLNPSDLKSGKFTGNLTLKGVTKKVTGRAASTGGMITATFDIDLNSFPVGVPSWLGVTVAEEVKITVKINI